MKLIALGAEAIIKEKNNQIIKSRIKKSYRIPQLDEKIRQQRTRTETKLLEKAKTIIPVPTVLSSSEAEKKIILENIKGKKLSQHLDKLKNKNIIATQIGLSLSKIHDEGIIHGDLTTSNLILKKDKVYFIDFGLGFISHKIEDKAVDLHLIKEALQAKHPKNAKQLFLSILKGYKSSKNAKATIQQLDKVEKRGRYKAQY